MVELSSASNSRSIGSNQYSLPKFVSEELKVGEVLNWHGKPENFSIAWKGSLGTVLFAIPWTAFALFWTAGASGFKIPNFDKGFDFFPLFGLPFILVGIGMFSTPYWILKKIKNTFYVITNNRVIVFEGKNGSKTKSYFSKDISNVEKKKNKDGTADLIFSSKSWKDSDGDSRTENIGLYGINDYKQVENFILELRGKNG